MKNILFFILSAAFMTMTVGAQERVTIKGSDTMVILAQRWAEKFMSKNPDVVLQVTGGGSGTGIAALINGTTEICNSSRKIKDSERAKLAEKYGSRGIEIKCALDGIALYVHQSNPVKELTLDQLKKMFTGKITNWKEVGGPDAKIILYSRENNSGTYVYFKEEVLNDEDFAPSALSLPGTAAVVNAVAKDKFGIGFGGAAYAEGVRDVGVKKDANSPALKPEMKSIKSGQYPISRFLYMYVIKRPTGNVKKYIDWALSKQGQKVVEEVGYFPIRSTE